MSGLIPADGCGSCFDGADMFLCEFQAADGFFTCIKKAYETLSSETDRRLFDSVDVPDGYDEIPKETKDAAKFWRDYPSAFTRNARWLKEDPPPVGGEDATEDEVLPLPSPSNMLLFLTCANVCPVLCPDSS